MRSVTKIIAILPGKISCVPVLRYNSEVFKRYKVQKASCVQFIIKIPCNEDNWCVRIGHDNRVKTREKWIAFYGSMLHNWHYFLQSPCYQTQIFNTLDNLYQAAYLNTFSSWREQQSNSYKTGLQLCTIFYLLLLSIKCNCLNYFIK